MTLCSTVTPLGTSAGRVFVLYLAVVIPAGCAVVVIVHTNVCMDICTRTRAGENYVFFLVIYT